MKVKLAVQVLSHSVAAGIRTMITLKQLPVEAKSTPDFIKGIDRLFDILNISTDRDLKKKDKSGRHLMDNFHLPERYFNYVESIHVVGKGRRPNCLKGLALTIRGIHELISDLKAEWNESVITRKLQQDTLENIFSFIRLKEGWNKNPTTRQFQT
jgi:hypothetical protein